MRLFVIIITGAIITGCGGGTQETTSAPNDPFNDVLTAQNQDKTIPIVSTPVDPFKQYILGR